MLLRHQPHNGNQWLKAIIFELWQNSLLESTQIQRILQAINNYPIYYGVKVSDKTTSEDIARKVGLNLETIAAINC